MGDLKDSDSSGSLVQKISDYAAMALFSFGSIALEIVYFHMLITVSNYLQSTFVISIALLGIAAGGVVAFYLSKVPTRIVLFVSALFYLAGMVAAYINIVRLAELRYPFFLILPFFFGSVAIASIFARTNANRVYFANLVASAAGVAYPIVMIGLVGSEDAIILLGLVPAIYIGFNALLYRNIFAKIAVGVVAIGLLLPPIILFSRNQQFPTEIPESDFAQILEDELVIASDRAFLERAYELDPEEGVYRFTAGEFDAQRAKFLFSAVDYIDYIDLNQDVVPASTFPMSEKHFSVLGADNHRVVYSGDSMVGRVELLFSPNGFLVLSLSGTRTDTLDSSRIAYRDPRFVFVPEADFFIVGLSADGITKGARGHNPRSLSGIEINPIIIELMEDDHPIGVWAGQPYLGIDVFGGEGRSFLEKNEREYDVISLMNIHPEFPNIATVSPEYFHTVEATELLLSRLSDRGIIAYEEIVQTERAGLFFQRFLNTIYTALENHGVENPRDHIMIYEWDFWGNANHFKTILLKSAPFTPEELRRTDVYLSRVAELYPPNMLVHPTRRTGSEEEQFLFGEERIYETQHFPRFVRNVVFTRDIAGKVFQNDDLQFVHRAFVQSNGRTGYWLTDLDEDDEARLAGIFDRIGYPYNVDLSPIRDDRPFPFGIWVEKTEVVELLQVLLLLVAVLLIPLVGRIVRQFGGRALIVSTHFLYFAMIGFSYMLVELILIQFFQQFIGSPTYSLLVVLGGFLLFNGIGSFVSAYLPRKWLYVALGLIPVVLIIMLLTLESIFAYFGNLELTGRLLISAVLLLPITILMGMPFPNAVERVKRGTSEEYGTLMFGINGAFSTLGATSSIVISVTHGFTTSFMVGVIGYVVAIGLFWVIDRVAVKPA